MKTLDRILDKMVETVGHSKDEIFRIGEQCRTDVESLTKELKELKQEVIKVIEEGNILEIKVRFARKRLAEVSKFFQQYTEEQVRQAYEKAHHLQMNLILNRQQEKQLRVRRDDIERQLQGLQATIERADDLVSQISVVMNYLDSDLKYVGELLENAIEKQHFGFKIIEAQEEERKRLSREIHDGPAQMLANVMMRSDLIERIYHERSGEEAISEIRSLRKMVRSALHEVRRIIYDLRPMALDDLGLVPTLKKYLTTTEEYHGNIQISFVQHGNGQRLPNNYEVALFRLIQESVQNAIKHADASEIQVKFEQTQKLVTAIIKDNGKGFDVNERRTESFGIIGMEERVELLDGELSIDSKIGIGTIVIIQIPLLKDVVYDL